MSSNTPPPVTPQPDETLAHLVKELNNAILALRTLIEREYPNRREIEAQFVKKTTANARLKLTLATIMIASTLGFMSSVGTITTCFLGDPDHPAVCNIIPGYAESQDRSEQLLEQFQHFIEQGNLTEKRVDKLEEAER